MLMFKSKLNHYYDHFGGHQKIRTKKKDKEKEEKRK